MNDNILLAAEAVQHHLQEALVESKKAATLAALGTIAETEEELKESAVAAYEAHKSLNTVADKVEALVKMLTADELVCNACWDNANERD